MLFEVFSENRKTCLGVESALCPEGVKLQFDALEPRPDVRGDLLSKEPHADRGACQGACQQAYEDTYEDTHRNHRLPGQSPKASMHRLQSACKLTISQWLIDKITLLGAVKQECEVT